MNIIETHIVPDGVSGIRFSDYAWKVINAIPSRKGIKKAIKNGELRINGEVSGTGAWVRPGQRIDLYDFERHTPKDYTMPLQVVYEDDYIALINKPAGIDVNGNKFRTVENALALNLAAISSADALKRPRPAHRLDSQTSGLLLIAKTSFALMALGRQFENRDIKKRYRAVVIGKTEERGRIERLVDGRDAITDYALVRCVPSLKNTWLSLIDLWPHTGRTHQLRRHMAETGFPILGDKLYGPEGFILRSKGLFLCAVELSFHHPESGAPMTIAIDEPLKFKTFLDRETRRYENYNNSLA